MWPVNVFFLSERYQQLEMFWIWIQFASSCKHLLFQLDYCNSLLMVSTMYQLDKLQRVLNVAARVVKCLWKYDPIRVHLFELHWLRVPQRIEFKVLTLVLKCVNNLAPEYLQDFLVVSRNTTLQLANTKKIHMVKFRTQKLLNCSSTYAAAKLWNDLPISLKSLWELRCF